MDEWRSALRGRLRHLRLSPAREASIVDELSQHLEDRRQELIAGGMDLETATQLTLAELGRADLLAPRLGTLRQAHWRPSPTPGIAARRPFDGIWQDLRYTWRTLRRDPLVTAVAILTLAFGIGLNTAMFGFMNALLFRPLPFPDAHTLVRISRTTAETGAGGFSPADYVALKEAEAAFGRVAAYETANLTPSDSSTSVEWLRVSANLFDVLGVRPARGRSFGAQDETPGRDRVILISTTFWHDAFGGAGDVVGRTIRAGDDTYEVIGVLPAEASDHRLFGRAAVYSPLPFDDGARADRRRHTINVLGRRAPSVSDAQAQALIASMGARMAADFPAENARTGWRSEALPESNTGPTGRLLLAMLLGLSIFVLLIACSNLANLLLARAIDRAREFAVRTALGASRLRLVRAVTLESLCLAAAGGFGALGVATWTTRWLQSVVVDGGGPMIPMDWRVLSFCAAVSISTVFFCGIAPALFAGRIGINETLKGGGRGVTAARGHVRLRNAFIVGQFALAMILLAGATLFVRGTRQMLSQPYGWSAERVVQGDLVLPADRYPKDADIIVFQRRLIERVSGIANVESVSVSYGLPFMGLRGVGQYVGEIGKDAAVITAMINGVSPSYFDVTGTRLIAGRFFDETDTASSTRVVILGETMARRLFGDSNPLGKRVAAAGSDPRLWMQVVGVVEDVHSIDLAQQPAPLQLYLPTAQDPRRGWVLAVRTAGGNPGAIVPSLRSAIAELDPSLTVRRLVPATERMREVTASMSLVTRLLTGFAVLGLLLAALGIYGAITRMVALRTDEIGLRMALGAQVGNVFGLVFASGARIVGIGVGIGLAGAFALSRLLQSVLPSMEINGGLVGLAATGILTTIALLACYLPARRATRVDPVVALRSE